MFIKAVSVFKRLAYIIYMTLDHKSSHMGLYCEMYTSFIQRWINKLSTDVWFVIIRLYLGEIQLFENLEGAKKNLNIENLNCL